MRMLLKVNAAKTAELREIMSLLLISRTALSQITLKIDRAFQCDSDVGQLYI